jgi:hypothetical protein
VGHRPVHHGDADVRHQLHLHITGFAFVVGGISDTVIESINKIGSALYGPILAAFLVGVLSPTATAPGVLAGVFGGVAFNLGLWLFVPEVFWMWWNFSELLVAVALTFLASRLNPRPNADTVRRYTLPGSGFFENQKLWQPMYWVLLLYFFVLLGILLFLNEAAEHLV